MSDHDYIQKVLLPEFAAHAQEKAKDYDAGGIENHKVLGVRGQFADIWRKIMKLKASLWDGKTLSGEQPREILLDLIGHAFLTIAMIDAENGRRVTAPAHLVDLEALAAEADRQARQRVPASAGDITGLRAEINEP